MTSQSDRHRRGGVLVGTLIFLVLAGATGWLGYRYWTDRQDSVSSTDLITRAVSRGPFDHVVLQQGEIESSSNIEIICEVQSRGSGGTQILWVIDEGTRVQAGDKLVELDSSQLEQELKEDRLRVITAESSVKTAEAVLEQAKIAWEEYKAGVYETEKRSILSEMAIAEQNLSRARLAFESTERLVAKGLVKDLQLEADKFAVVNAENNLEAEKQKLSVLRDLTLRRMEVQFTSDIESAETALRAAQSELEERRAEMQEREQQIRNCVMYAPSDGVVVHANRYSSRGGNAEFVVEAGAMVRERQPIIRLPDPTKMQVRCKVNESQITLIQSGMPVKIAIDAMPGLRLRGRVARVNRYAEPGGWMSSAIKEYATTIEIIDPPEDIRTGMTAAVEIFVEQLPDALQIPIQGLYEHGGQMFTLVRKRDESEKQRRDRYETRVVKIGATNDTMASIVDGLDEDENVILNLRQHLTLLDLPPIEREDNSDLDELRQIDPETRLTGAATPQDATAEGGAAGGWGEGQGSRGGQAGGGGPGGGRPDVATIVQRSMERNDTDGDGVISREEAEAADGRAREMLLQADSDGDGKVTRAELRAALEQRMAGNGGDGE